MDRPPLRCLAGFLPLDVLPALLKSLLELLTGVAMLAIDGPPVAGVLGARLEACKHKRALSLSPSQPEPLLHDPECRADSAP